MMLETTPLDPFLHYALALEEAALTKVNEAINRSFTILVDFPDYLPTYYTLAVWLSGENRIEEAFNVAKSGLTLATKMKDSRTQRELQTLINDIE